MVTLKESDSAAFMLDATDRHAHLCRQTPKGATYETNVAPAYNELKAKNDARILAEKETSKSLDLVRLADRTMDDIMRKLHNRSAEHDRDNPGAKTLTQLFPEGKLLEVTNLPYEKETDFCLVIAQKIETFGSSHALYPFVAQIQQQAQTCKAAIEGHKASIKTEAAAWADEQIAKFALMRQYNNNYYLAATDFDKAFAESLFPNIRSGKKDDKTEDTTGTK